MNAFKNLVEFQKYFHSEEVCREFLEKNRWPNGLVCPFCQSQKVYRFSDGRRFKCAERTCNKKFTVTVGAIYENSKVPLQKWFLGMYIIENHKKGISSCQLAKDIGVTQKSAWFMLHRIREMMREKQNIKLDNIVEIDEVYIGGKVGNMSKKKRTLLRAAGKSYDTKTLVMGLIERGGDLKLMALDKSNDANTLKPVIRKNVDFDAVVITDGLNSYCGLDEEFSGHEVINHAGDEYVRDGVIHTNTIEGAFSMLRRSIFGIYHKVSPKHLSRYCDETMYRYNSRKMKDTDRFTFSLNRIEGRLKYKNLIGKPGLTKYQIENIDVEKLNNQVKKIEDDHDKWERLAGNTDGE